jgi:hypothetical protein
MNGPKPDPAAVFDALADLIVDRLADRIAGRVALDAAAFYTQHTAPVGKRAFLEAARRGEFPSSKRGRTVLAKRSDVEAWIERGRRAPTTDNDVAALVRRRVEGGR